MFTLVKPQLAVAHPKTRQFAFEPADTTHMTRYPIRHFGDTRGPHQLSADRLRKSSRRRGLLVVGVVVREVLVHPFA